jgi:cell division protein FtsL
MSATPRTIRSITVPAAPRFRRVAGVNTRRFGPITMFLIATAILGVTSLCFVWQAGVRTAAGMNIQDLQSRLAVAQNTQYELQSQIAGLTSNDTILSAAATRFHMRAPDSQTVVYPVVVPGPVITKVVVVRTPPTRPTTAVRLPTTDAAVASWWQNAWAFFSRLLR